MNTSAPHTHKCTLKHSHGINTGAHRHTVSWSAVASKLICNISYVCCSITFNIRIYVIYTDVVVAAVSLMLCLRCFLFLSAGIEANVWFFFLFVFFFPCFFFFLPLSLYPHSPFFLSLSSPSCWLSPQPFFLIFFFYFFNFFLFIYLFIFLSSFSLLFSLSPGLVCHSVVK